MAIDSFVSSNCSRHLLSILKDTQYHSIERFYRSARNKLNVPTKFKFAAVLGLFFISLLNGQAFADSGKSQSVEFKTIDWIDLIPEDELDILLNPPSYIDDIVDGSFEDGIGSQIKNTLTPAKDDPYQQALISTKVKPGMDGQSVGIPGFIVPLEFDDELIVTEFFLVPYFGACMHLPPPAPNQIIYVKYAKGLELKTLYDPFWIYGTLKTSTVENDMATAAYSIDMASYKDYTEEDYMAE
jgi:hypothetical protein